MRIAVSQADLDSGRFSAISRSLAKAWPHGKLSLMQAQGKLSQLLGYRSLHDLQQSAKGRHLLPPKAATREQIAASVAWKLSRLAPLPLADAREAVKGLRLNMLEVDASTPEAAFEEAQKSVKASGRMLVLDEAGTLFGSDWHPRTPELLDCGAPPYTFAVLPDRRAFSWNRLTSLIDSLPNGFEEDLVMEDAYAGLRSGAEVFGEFVSKELLPQAYAPLAQAIKRDKRLPNGFAIRWLMNEENRVIGRVVENWALGGIIPVLYDAQNDDIFETLADLMCGVPVHVPHVPSRVTHINAFVPLYGYQGFDVAADGGRLAELPDETLQSLCPVAYWDKNAVLDAGEERLFTEQGQVYVRFQQHNFLSPERIPSWLAPLGEIPDVIRRWPASPGSDVFPAGVEALRSAVAAELKGLYRRAEDAATRWTNESVVQASLGLAPARALDQYLDHEAFIEDESQRYALTIRGREAKEITPALQGYADLTVGVVCSKVGKGLTDIESVAGILVYSAFCASSVDPQGADAALVEGRAPLLAYMILVGLAQAEELVARALELERLERGVDLLESKRQRIFKWRSEVKAQQQLRADGLYLIADQPISRAKPDSLIEMQAHSTGLKSRYRL